MAEHDEPQIADHGLIGDLRSAALVARDGTVAWFCAPRFDSPSVFASILDADQGGHWKIEPDDDPPGLIDAQFYFPDTNILITRFLSEQGVVEVEDFMPVRKRNDAEHRQRIVRRVRAVRGSMRMRTEVAPRFGYGAEDHEVEEVEQGVRFAGPDLTLEVRGSVDLKADGRDGRAAFDLSEGDTALFVLDVVEDGEDAAPLGSRAGAERLFEETVAFWREWLEQSTYEGRWRETVHRSALTLKLMTHEPTGAVIAGPTTSLPERIGGERNWDYRYVWIRDASFSLYALLSMGFTEEASAFMGWLTDRFRGAGDGELGPLRVLYTIDGGEPPKEITLDNLAGHRGSKPVRVGNAAMEQLQLDIYGELIDSVYLFNKYGTGITAEAWEDLREVVAWLCDNWDRADEGIWEPRAGRADHTYSRLMCWVALERMIRVARQRGLPADMERWRNERDQIYEQIMDRGWSDQREAFVQAYDDGDTLDASLLLMPMVKFLAPHDPRFASTLEAIEQTLVADSLVFRYDLEQTDDGLEGGEGTFSICSFWYVEALTRAGRLEDARLALEKMFTYANHLGLYAEQIGLAGDQLGNFPQAFTHLALISAAINLDRSLG